MNKIKLLIVDDEPNGLVSDFAKWLQLTEQFEVEIEAFGSGAPSAVRRFQPDVILLDWLLLNESDFGPGGDGISLAKKWRSNQSGYFDVFKEIPLIIFTSWGADDVNMALEGNNENNGIYVAYKDWEFPVVLAYIANVLFRSRMIAN